MGRCAEGGDGRHLGGRECKGRWGQLCEQPPAVGGPRHGGDPPLQVPLQHHRARGHLVALAWRPQSPLSLGLAQKPKLGRRQWTIGHHLKGAAQSHGGVVERGPRWQVGIHRAFSQQPLRMRRVFRLLSQRTYTATTDWTTRVRCRDHGALYYETISPPPPPPFAGAVCARNRRTRGCGRRRGLADPPSCRTAAGTREPASSIQARVVFDSSMSNSGVGSSAGRTSNVQRPPGLTSKAR